MRLWGSGTIRPGLILNFDVMFELIMGSKSQCAAISRGGLESAPCATTTTLRITLKQSQATVSLQTQQKRRKQQIEPVVYSLLLKWWVLSSTKRLNDAFGSLAGLAGDKTWCPPTAGSTTTRLWRYRHGRTRDSSVPFMTSERAGGQGSVL